MEDAKLEAKKRYGYCYVKFGKGLPNYEKHSLAKSISIFTIENEIKLLISLKATVEILKKYRFLFEVKQEIKKL